MIKTNGGPSRESKCIRFAFAGTLMKTGTGTTLTGAVVGVAVYPSTTAYYGWVQTRGPAGVLIAPSSTRTPAGGGAA